MGWRWGGTAFLARYKETFYLPRPRGGTQSLLLVMPSSFIGAFLNRFPPSSSNCSTYSLQLTRRIVFAALFLHLQRDASPAGNLCDARYSFYVVFFPFSPFSFLFFLLCLPFALIMYRATYSYLVAGAEGAR